MQLVQTEQAQTEGLEIGTLAALQRYAGSNLHPVRDKGAAALNFGIVGIGDHDAGGFKSGRRHTREIPFGQQAAYFAAQFALRFGQFVETDAFGFAHHVVQAQQAVSRHRGVVGMAAVFKCLHDLQPFFQVEGEAVGLGFLRFLISRSVQHDQAATGRSAPAFLRCGKQDVDTEFFHIEPDAA